jgi:hypothetical protein
MASRCWKLCLALFVGFLGVCFAGKADLAMVEDELCNNVLVSTCGTVKFGKEFCKYS